MPEPITETSVQPDGIHQHSVRPRAPVLVLVEDDPLVRPQLCKLVRKMGAKVLAASDGPDALRICGRFRGPIDLLVTDIHLPGLSGFELADRATRLRPALPVLFLSGGFREQDVEIQGALAPNRAFLEKPFTRDGLAWKLKRLIAASPRADELRWRYEPIRAMPAPAVDDPANGELCLQITEQLYDLAVRRYGIASEQAIVLRKVLNHSLPGARALSGGGAVLPIRES